MGRKSKAKIRKQEILSHFYEVIIEEGFEGASIAKIAKRMDVNPSLLIHYFSTKDAMVLGLIDYIVNTYSSHLLPDFSQVSDPAERWDDVIDVLTHHQWDVIMNQIVFYSCYTLSLRNPDIKERFVDLYREIVQRLSEEITFASKNGILSVKDSEKAATWIMSIIEGANFFQHVKMPHPTEEPRPEALKAIILHTLQGDLF